VFLPGETERGCLRLLNFGKRSVTAGQQTVYGRLSARELGAATAPETGLAESRLPPPFVACRPCPQGAQGHAFPNARAPPNIGGYPLAPAIVAAMSCTLRCMESIPATASSQRRDELCAAGVLANAAFERSAQYFAIRLQRGQLRAMKSSMPPSAICCGYSLRSKSS
jgi:hypothetical protein